MLCIEIRHFDMKISNGKDDDEFKLLNDETDCSLSFIENVNNV